METEIEFTEGLTPTKTKVLGIILGTEDPCVPNLIQAAEGGNPHWAHLLDLCRIIRIAATLL